MAFKRLWAKSAGIKHHPMKTRKVTFLVAASPTEGFMSQIAAFDLALKRLNWERWQPTMLVCFGAGLDRNAYAAYARWRPYLQDVTIVFAPESQPNEYWHNQMDGIYRWAPADADVLVRVDADTLPLRNLEPVLDLILERSAIGGSMAHGGFPKAPGVSNHEAWLAVAEGFLSEPLRFDYRYTLFVADLPEQECATPYYLNDGCVFFARKYLDRFVPLYLETRPKIMKRLHEPWWACQVALALSVARIDLPAIELPLRYNFPNDEIAAKMYPAEMRNATIEHYLRTNEFDRQNIFRSAACYADFLSKPLNAPNEAFRTAVLNLFGKTYPFETKASWRAAWPNFKSRCSKLLSQTFVGRVIRSERTRGDRPTPNNSQAGAAAAHPRDISDDDVSSAVASAARPDLLLQLIDISRRTFRFYPSYYPYTITYPWIASKLEALPTGAKILDIGAGLNPLPLFLAEKGSSVDCVDAHSLIRTLPSQPDWNEWGFFDYRQIHPNLTSHHSKIAEFTPPGSFDAIYSACVLAHMPHEVREDTVSRSRRWLRAGGILLFVIDLIPSTKYIWNFCAGLEVESPEEHGTTDDLLGQLTTLGFQINEARSIREIPKSRTDIFLVHCTAP